MKLRIKPRNLHTFDDGTVVNQGGRDLAAHESPTGTSINAGETFEAPRSWYLARNHWHFLEIVDDMPTHRDVNGTEARPEPTDDPLANISRDEADQQDIDAMIALIEETLEGSYNEKKSLAADLFELDDLPNLKSATITQALKEALADLKGETL